MPIATAKVFGLAGFFAAHSVWCVSEGETLIPLVGTTDSDGKRNLHRMATEELSEGVTQGKKYLEDIKGTAAEAVLCYDGYITIGDTKMDAIFLDMRSSIDAKFEALMAVPYEPAKDGKEFKVYRPKFINLPEGTDLEAVAMRFFDGVDQHKQGSEVWNKHIDQSR